LATKKPRFLRGFFVGEFVALSILKIVEFDDGHTNWNSWVGRHPFI
jgi:hypothetical protein